ncbi:hypothetical protein BXZ70DRAFT_929169 [Cristinia sonorae]|uniref:Defect at low temperature protein 1 n=1 Tax=Cristinia sonorae TaxID=1940300 RepID=A0A8K0URQ8_9AGAR|nr:hypothetical protein BXZ70DRAFT_929169 [Cristinia sonorae]
MARGTTTLSLLFYAINVLVTTFFVCLSCVALLSQAVRSSTHQSWKQNFNAAIIGGTYAAVAMASIGFCLKRRIAIHRRLQRISKESRTLERGDVPRSVWRYMQQEYARACLVTFEAEPKAAVQQGWGKPGTPYEGVQYRSTLLRTIRDIDKLAHAVIPRHPPLRPHDRMLHHFRFILPLFTKDEEGLTPLHYYDSAVQLVRHSSREPTEAEFIIGMKAVEEITETLEGCRAEMEAGSMTERSESLFTDPDVL